MILYGSAQSEESTTKVYFVPFEVETYVPITPETIESQAWEKWTISSKEENSRLLRILRGGPEGAYDKNKTRVLIIFGKESYYVDSSGVVRLDGKRDARIDKSALITFRDSLRPDQRQDLRKQQ